MRANRGSAFTSLTLGSLLLAVGCVNLAQPTALTGGEQGDTTSPPVPATGGTGGTTTHGQSGGVIPSNSGGATIGGAGGTTTSDGGATELGTGGATPDISDGEATGGTGGSITDDGDASIGGTGGSIAGDDAGIASGGTGGSITGDDTGIASGGTGGSGAGGSKTGGAGGSKTGGVGGGKTGGAGGSKTGGAGGGKTGGAGGNRTGGAGGSRTGGAGGSKTSGAGGTAGTTAAGGSPSTDDAGVPEDALAPAVDAEIDAPQNPDDAPAGLFLYYSCEQSSGTTLPDMSGNGRDGTLKGSTSFTPGKVGNALALNSTPDGGAYVEMPLGSLASFQEITIATWFKITSALQYQRIFDISTSPTVGEMFLTTQYSTGNLHFTIRTTLDGGIVSRDDIDGPTIPVDTWEHVAVVIDAAGNGRMYLNGAQIGSVTAMTMRLSDLGTPLNDWIGRSVFVADPSFNGAIDEFRIYNRALSAAEVVALYSP